MKTGQCRMSPAAGRRDVQMKTEAQNPSSVKTDLH